MEFMKAIPKVISVSKRFNDCYKATMLAFNHVCVYVNLESVNLDEENIVNRENSDTERLNEEESMEIEKDAHDLNNVEKTRVV